jgi:hypothetical protein
MQTALKKIVMEDWFEKKNVDKIITGMKMENPQHLFKFEHMILSLVLQLGTMLITYILKARIEQREFQLESNSMAREELGPELKNEKYRTVRVKLLTGGIATIRTTYCRLKSKKSCGRKKTKRGEAGNGCYPALSRLGIHYRMTPGLISRISREMAEGPSIDGVKRRLAWFGHKFSDKTIRTVTENFASDGLEWREKWVTERDMGKAPKTESFEGKRVEICIDGGRMRVRKNRKGRLPKGKRHHRYDRSWREPKLFSIAVLDENGHKSRHHDPIYDGTLGNADEAFELLETYLSYYSIEKAKEITFLGDGAPWIWERVDQLFEHLGIDPNRVHQTVDFYHAAEHLNDVLVHVSWTGKKKKRWYRQMRNKLRNGHVDHVITEIKRLCRGRNAGNIKKEMGYFLRHRNRMNYRMLRDANLPIGSGLVESAMRRVVNLRLKGAGTFWLEENAEGLVFLRSHLKSGRWCELLSRVFGHLSIGVCPGSLEMVL